MDTDHSELVASPLIWHLYVLQAICIQAVHRICLRKCLQRKCILAVHSRCFPASVGHSLDPNSDEQAILTSVLGLTIRCLTSGS